MTSGRSHICFISMDLYATLRPGIATEAGGAEFQILQIARGMCDRGYPVSLITGDFGQPFRQKIDGFNVLRANRVAHDRSVRRGLSNAGRLWRAIDAAGADFYVLRSTRFLAAPCLAFARLHRAKFVFMIASMANCDPHDSEGIPRWLNRLYGATLRRADVVTAQTGRQVELLRRNFGVDAAIVPNGIITPPLQMPAPKTTDVLWVGSIKPIKQPNRLADFVRMCPDLRFTIIGGPGADRAYHSRIVAELSALPNAEYLGFVPPDRIGDHYRRARLLLSTSAREGFPNTYLYAWSRGVPTCSPSIDPDGVVQRKGLGIIAEDPRELAARMRELLADPEAYAGMAQRCHSHARDHHAIEQTVAQFVRILPAVPVGPQGGRDAAVR